MAADKKSLSKTGKITKAKRAKAQTPKKVNGKAKNGNNNNTSKFPLAEDFKQFTTHVESLAHSFAASAAVLNAVRKKGFNDYEKFIGRYCDESVENSKRLIHVKSPEYARRFESLHTSVNQLNIALNVLPETFLVSLVSQYDAFLRSLLRDLLLLNSETLKGWQGTIKVCDLAAFTTLEEAKRFLIEREIDEIMRGSHTDQIEYIEKTFKVEWTRDSLWGQFIEITERRNLFVHTNGYVTGQYLRVCKEKQIKVGPTVEEGVRLSVNGSYFWTALYVLLELATKLSQVLWRKHLPDALAQADETLDCFCFGLLCKKRYELLLRILTFATTTLRSKISGEEYFHVNMINTALIHKRMKNSKKMAECLAAVDWTKTGDKYSLAEAVLNERYHDAEKFMKKLGKEMSPADYRDFPVFDGFRETVGFKKAYEEIFGKQFTSEPPEPTSQVLAAQNIEEATVTDESETSDGDSKPAETIQ
jgi:hypothetical protein